MANLDSLVAQLAAELVMLTVLLERANIGTLNTAELADIRHRAEQLRDQANAATNRQQARRADR